MVCLYLFRNLLFRSYVISNYVDFVPTVKEKTTVNAMELIHNKVKIVVEPSGAVPFAVVLQYNHMFERAKIGIILSGGMSI